MTTDILRDVRLWFAGYELHGAMNSLALDGSVPLHDTPVFGDTGKRRLAGLPDVVAQLEGYWAGGEGEIDEILATRIGVANVPVTIAPPRGTAGALTGAAGQQAYFFRAIAGQYIPGGKIGDPFPFTARAESSAGEKLVLGTLLHNATRATSASGTPYNVGAVASDKKLYAALHILGCVDPADTLAVIVESDALEAFGSPATQITFSTASAIGSQWATAVAGPITDGWWRVSWTVGGAAPSFPFVVVMGIQ